jgi:hypothetical protein
VPSNQSNFLDRILTIAVAPVLNFPGALGRVNGSLAPLAAVAPLTRPARSRVVGNYRSDVCGNGFLATDPIRCLNGQTRPLPGNNE